MGENTFLRGPADWWRQAVVYQIYPRSFADLNGDGIGDFAGIIDRVPYLASLGIDAVWLSPFYPSELADGGYDVADYRNVDPRIGTLEEFDRMTEALHAHGIRIFVDIVPNHSSDQHEWFQAALKAGRGSAERDRYIFREGKGENGELPPSKLASHFGPEGWTRVEDGQWYMHLFAKEQPDFNWGNQEVRDDFLKTLKFWSDRGVDGYRVDVAHALIKDLADGHLPERDSYDLEVMKTDGTDDLFDRDEVHEVYKTWRQVFDQYDPPRVAVAEAWVHAHRRPAYASAEGLGQSFNFDLLVQPWNPKQFKKTITYNLAAAERSGSSTTWVLSNHDNIRHATKYGVAEGFDLYKWQHSKSKGNSLPQIDIQKGIDRARAAVMLELALPGSTYLYQGEELGLHEVFGIPADQMQDPQWFRSLGEKATRDGCRVPLPWTAEGSSFGFGPGGAHLPQPEWFAEYAVEVEEADEDSTLNLYRKALRLRKKLLDVEKYEWVRSWNRNVLHFKRPNGWHSITNFGDKPVKMPKGEVILTSTPLVDGMLPGNATAWFLAK